MIGKAEYLAKGSNPRFIVTSLAKRQLGAKHVYERIYCARGEMENRIKEQQLGLFADRTSMETMRANQLRLHFSSIAYTLMDALRRLGLKGTEFARAQCTTIRLKLLKIRAQIQVTVRRNKKSLRQSPENPTPLLTTVPTFQPSSITAPGIVSSKTSLRLH